MNSLPFALSAFICSHRYLRDFYIKVFEAHALLCLQDFLLIKMHVLKRNKVRINRSVFGIL